MSEDLWVDVGLVENLQRRAVQQVMLGRTKVALTYQDGQFGAINGLCNHVGRPLGEGTVEGEYVVCPACPSAWLYQMQFKRQDDGQMRRTLLSVI